ncbi:MAG: sugar transferase [Planctomycetes bacterium]|nr:sugar transferase [Planctomycetota bacterium]
MNEYAESSNGSGSIPSDPAVSSLQTTAVSREASTTALFDLMRRVHSEVLPARTRSHRGRSFAADLLGTPWDVGKQLFSPRWWALAQRLIALVALVLLLPLYVAIALAIRLNSPGPTFFHQVRRGFLGQPFVIRKFRTMARGKASEDALVVQMSDPKVTAVGRLLRFLKLDELPQMWNVVRGDMQLVGPRPIPGNLERELVRELPGFRARYTTHPGLTNLSQIAIDDNAVGDGMLHDWETRLAGELVYLREKSVVSDLLIIARTVSFLVRRFVQAFAARGPFARRRRT